MALIDDLKTEVTETTDVMDSAVLLLGKLHDKLEAAGTDPAKLQELKDTLAQNKAELAEAIVAHTPAE